MKFLAVMQVKHLTEQLLCRLYLACPPLKFFLDPPMPHTLPLSMIWDIKMQHFVLFGNRYASNYKFSLLTRTRDSTWNDNLLIPTNHLLIACAIYSIDCYLFLN